MAQYGINLNPRHPVGQPRNIVDLRTVRWARIVFQAAAALQTVDQAFGFYDPLILQYSQIGMRTLMVLNQETFWGNAPWNSGDWAQYATDFANVCAQIATHYRGQGIAYEIWNEGDIHGASSIYVPPADFAKVLDAASRAIRQADPTALVTFGGLAAGVDAAIDYVNDTRKALGSRLPVDSISIHPYGKWPPNFSQAPDWGGWFGPLDDHLKRFNNAFSDYPIWITEIGISEAIPYPPEEYAMVTKYMQGIYDLVRTKYPSRVTMVVWFAWSDVMRNAGIVDSNNVPKTRVYNKFFQIAAETASNPPPEQVNQLRGIILATTDGLSVRSGPGTSYERLTVIRKNTEVKALEPVESVTLKLGKNNQWLNIRTPIGVEGWSAAWYLKFSRVLVASTDGLNIRSGPGTEHNKVGSVVKGTVMEALEPMATAVAKVGVEGQWLQVRTPEDVTGYAAAWYLTLGDEATQEPPPTIIVYPTANLNIRSGPGTSFPKFITVQRNTELQSVEPDSQTLIKVGQQDQWLHVATPEGDGYAAAWYLALEPVSEPDPVRLTPTTNLNLREGPKSTYIRNWAS
ncbi:MAG: SH3 domain-containing protein [Anaerolineae bacterium]|nr:SH3 domain-containing protein [Anaerolineae bacterium]